MSADEDAISRKYGVAIFKPKSGNARPAGVSVLLPGTILKLASYASTRDALLAQNQLVIGFQTLNPLPIIGQSHDKMAQAVRDVVGEVCNLDKYKPMLQDKKYNLVGHSLGGKVALMVAAKYDNEKVNIVIAMDPVDGHPEELTYPKDQPTTNLNNATCSEIHLLQSELGGQGLFPLCPASENATVIKDMYPNKITSFTLNQGASHMSYLDSDKNVPSTKARVCVHALIKERITS